MKQNLKLDQFYTNPNIAKACVDDLYRIVSCEYREQFIEPSAGNGAFLQHLPMDTVAIDLDPKNDKIIKADFFDFIISKSTKKICVIGNPPFGKRSSLAIQFFNKAATFAEIIAFIVPNQFRKWSVQSQLDFNFCLIFEKELPDNSFLVDGSPYDVGCVFQIWQRNCKTIIDKRRFSPPITTHPDFKMWQYNNTTMAEKVFENDFDFAVPRQGYHDFSRREMHSNNCERTTQWILFKAKSELVKNRLLQLDFDKLSKLNTSTPGFGKADVIQEYERLYKDENDLSELIS